MYFTLVSTLSVAIMTLFPLMFQMGYGGDYGAGGRNQMEVRNHVFNCKTFETCNAVQVSLAGN